MTATPAVSLLGHQLHEASPGPEAETVLLLNGSMMSHAAWGPVTERLQEGYQVLACDFRGQLLSPGEGHPALEDNLPDVVELLDHLELEQVHVLGTSYGGEVAALFAARHGERVRTLALATASDRMPDGMLANARKLQGLARQVLEGGEHGPFFDALIERVYSPEYREAHAADFAARRQTPYPEPWYQGLQGILTAVQGFDVSQDLPNITCPTLVLHAAQDEIMPKARVRALAQGIPGAELEVHPASGHALLVEDPSWLAERYLAFLARHA